MGTMHVSKAAIGQSMARVNIRAAEGHAVDLAASHLKPEVIESLPVLQEGGYHVKTRDSGTRLWSRGYLGVRV